MFELSPLVTEAKAPASSMCASARSSRSKPNPTTCVPLKSGGSRRNARAFLSTIATECPPCSNAPASSLPTRPHPMTTTCNPASRSRGRRMLRPSEPAGTTPVPAGVPREWHADAGRTAPSQRGPKLLDTVKRVLVGRPLATSEQEHQRLGKAIALAVFSSDAISSTAYATEEILFVIAVAPSSLALGLSKLVPIAIMVAILLALVATSYRQTIFAYPSGGGSYIVSRQNLGENPALVAGASLLVDYILTVAVSISAGVAAIISIPQFEGLEKHRVGVALVIILL